MGHVSLHYGFPPFDLCHFVPSPNVHALRNLFNRQGTLGRHREDARNKAHFRRGGFLNDETGLKAIERHESRDWMANINLRAALPAPDAGSQRSALPNKAVTADIIDGTSTVVADGPLDSQAVDDIASKW